MTGGFTELPDGEIRRRLVKAQNNSKEDPLLGSPYPKDLLKGEPRPAAVLIPFLRTKDTWHILFIRRSENADDRHSGQVAFPGGGANPNDTDSESTALREAYEEIGLKPADVQILGHLTPFITITNYRVVPVVGKMPWPYPLHLQQSEVSKAFTIPLNWLADPANHEEHPRSLPPPFGSIPVIYFKPYQGEVLWGASARIILTLLDILFKK